MPVLTVLWLRTSLVYFIGGLFAGAALLLQKAFAWDARLWFWLPIHIEWMTIGFMLQFVIGVAYWILPRLEGPHERGDPRIAQWSYALINSAVLMITLSLFLDVTWLQQAGHALTLAGVFLIARIIWPRLYSLRSTTA